MSQQIIIAMSGRKAAGKNTVASFLAQYFVDECLDDFLLASQLSNPKSGAKGNIRDYLIDKFVLECSFADNLKRFCIDTLGLTHEQCYGNDDEKNTLTEYDWYNAPKFLQWKFGDDFAKEQVAAGCSQNELMWMFFEREYDHTSHKKPGTRYLSGKMSGREIMQIFGTDLIRQTFGNVWAEATIRSIKKTGKVLSFITDNRFPNEIEAVLKQPSGFIIRLTRSPFGQDDAHPSESALDCYDWNHPKCFILDNAKLTIEEQNEAVKPILHKILGV